MDHENLTTSLNLGVRVSLQAEIHISVPYHDFESDTGVAGADRTQHGLGDITIFGLFHPWAGEDSGEFLDESRLSFIAGLKLPTGDDDLDVFIGSTGEVVPLGRGTTDLLVGLSYRVPIEEWILLFESLVFTIPLNENDDDPPPGTILGSKSAFSFYNRFGANVKIAEWLDAYLALELNWKEDDDDPRVGGDSGETLFFVTPGAVATISDRVVFDVSFRAAHTFVSAGLSVRF